MGPPETGKSRGRHQPYTVLPPGPSEWGARSTRCRDTGFDGTEAHTVNWVRLDIFIAQHGPKVTDLPQV